MAVHRLFLDDSIDEMQYTLIGIHCRLEDYRLAYLLNQYLGISLKRRKTDLDLDNGKESYSIFEWEDIRHLVAWNMVSNICKTEEIQKKEYKSLFGVQNKITKTLHLLPDYKTVNYLLKIETEYSKSKEKYIVDAILSIPQIATAYSIDPGQLKSKENLIFN